MGLLPMCDHCGALLDWDSKPCINCGDGEYLIPLDWYDTTLNLAGVDRSGMNMANALVSGADLSGANLSGANLKGAKGTGANLSGATMPDGTIHD